MRQVFVNLLLYFLAGFLFDPAGFWSPLKVVQCQDLPTSNSVPYCYDTSSGKICFTPLLNQSLPVRRPLKEASRLCKSRVSGSSLIATYSQEIQDAFSDFLSRQILLQTEEIITDARMLSADESQTWSWVNGQLYSPDIIQDVVNTDDAACVESKSKKSLEYCFGNAFTLQRWICEFPGFSSNDSGRYIVNEEFVRWYDARKDCLRSGGDLASLTDLQTIQDLLSVRENKKYWIGLYRNKWIWNSTGSALTYMNWRYGLPGESSDKQCICFRPLCHTYTEMRICDAQIDHKWTTCDCNNSYAIICQSEEKPSTTVARFTTPTNTSTNRSTTLTRAATSTSTSPLKTGIPMNTDATTFSHDTTKNSKRQTALTSPMTQDSSSNSFEHKPTEIATHSAGGVSNEVVGLNTTGILIIVLLTVAVVIIIVAAILFSRKRKHGRRNDGSPVKNTQQDGAVSCVYANVVADNRPSDDTLPADNTIYDELDMIQQPMPSNNTIYASVQPTSEAIDMGGSVVYADLDIK